MGQSPGNYLYRAVCGRCDGYGVVGDPNRGWKFWKRITCPECDGTGRPKSKAVVAGGKPLPPPPPPAPSGTRVRMSAAQPPSPESRRGMDAGEVLGALLVLDAVTHHGSPDIGNPGLVSFDSGGGESGGAGASGGWDSSPYVDSGGSFDAGFDSGSSGGDSSSGAW